VDSFTETHVQTHDVSTQTEISYDDTSLSRTRVYEVSSTPIKVNKHKKRNCGGLQHLPYISYCLNRFGPCVTKDSTNAIALASVNTNSANYFSIDCTGAPSSSKKARCNPCDDMKRFVKSSYDSHKNEERIPSVNLPREIASLKEQLLDKEECIKLQELEISRLKSNVSALQEQKKIVSPKDPLVELLEEILQKKPEYAKCFNYKIVRAQFLAVKYGTKHRWDPDIIPWANTIKYIGGHSVIDALRGRVGANGSHFSVDDIAFYIPPNETLLRYTPEVTVYNSSPIERIDLISRLVKNAAFNDGGLVWDWMEIRKRVYYDPIRKIIVGGIVPISMEHFDPAYPDRLVTMLNDYLAEQVMAVYYVSTCSNINVPVGFIPAKKGSTIDFTVKELRKIIEKLKEHDVRISWTSSDSFAGADAVVELLMPTLGEEYIHFFDYEHLLKNARNILINSEIYVSDKVAFTMNDLRTAWRSPQFRACLDMLKENDSSQR
jgi:hypothetical protein